ncbi:hypothetical protein [Chlorogloea sp. CCALA 695]|uniref:hypothetical protein n=1 Tax=Chlorogloea sp. CCALA 695 TaxID=2107693 RepID=UPI000D05C695|nr:hypothetical protein [Chlorogloea sp. CCALA 695]PSB27932.1 hypothetical protein C7B70_21545 [Chlorogloea sp. CCALA 695]
MNEQLLERIASALENLKEKPTLSLGFCTPPSSQYIFVGNEPEQGLWYFLSEDSKKNYIPQKALTGTIKKLEVVHREYKNQELVKLDITIESDRIYVVRTGFGTVFCKGLLLALNTLNSLDKPLIIAVAPGEETVVFARVYDAATKKPIMTEWQSEADFAAILHRLQGMLAIWRNWKSPADAIAWAVTQLPDVPRDVLEAEFEELETTNGKKADRWVARVEDLKVEVF